MVPVEGTTGRFDTTHVEYKSVDSIGSGNMPPADSIGSGDSPLPVKGGTGRFDRAHVGYNSVNSDGGGRGKYEKNQIFFQNPLQKEQKWCKI